jgi:hypothetical protein
MSSEYSDRHIGRSDNPPLLNATCYESDDGELVQFLVTVRNNVSGRVGAGRSPVGHIRAAIIACAEERGIDCAHAGRPHMAYASKGKRG